MRWQFIQLNLYLLFIESNVLHTLHHSGTHQQVVHLYKQYYCHTPLSQGIYKREYGSKKDKKRLSFSRLSQLLRGRQSFQNVTIFGSAQSYDHVDKSILH